MLVSPCWSLKTEGTAQYPVWEKYTYFLKPLVMCSIKFYYCDDEDDDREFRKVHGITLVWMYWIACEAGIYFHPFASFSLTPRFLATSFSTCILGPEYIRTIIYKITRVIFCLSYLLPVKMITDILSNICVCSWLMALHLLRYLVVF